MPGSAPAQRLTDACRVARTEAASLGPLVSGLLAIGWATVDLHRATRALVLDLGLVGEEPFRAAPRCAALGGRCLIAEGVLAGGASLVVLEPDTEGRLAASLARLDEGPVVTWLAGLAAGPVRPEPGSPPLTRLDPPGREGLTLSSESDGPFGPERLIVDANARALGQSWRLIVRAAGTIQP